MILVCSTLSLPVLRVFEGYEEKCFEFAQLLLQECEGVCYFSPYTNSQFPGVGDATCLLNLGDNSGINSPIIILIRTRLVVHTIYVQTATGV